MEAVSLMLSVVEFSFFWMWKTSCVMKQNFFGQSSE